MRRDDLVELVQKLLSDYDPGIVAEQGTLAWDKLVQPLLDRFAEDPLAGDPEAFVRDTLLAKFGDHDLSTYGALSDEVGTPMRLLLEPLRREQLRTRLTQGLNNLNILTTEEAEGLLSISAVTRDSGSRASLTVRIYFARPRLVEVPLTAVAFTINGLRYKPTQFWTFLAELVVLNKEGLYYYVDVPMVAESAGAKYSIASGAVKGVIGVSGALSATNKMAADPGRDAETIEEYRDRVRNNASEHAPCTAPGHAEHMEALAGVRGIFVAGHGDPLMTRDWARWNLADSVLRMVMLEGSGGALTQHVVPFNTIADYEFPYSTIIEDSEFVGLGHGYTPAFIIVGGRSYDIASHVGDTITFKCFEELAHGEDGTTMAGLPVPGGGCTIQRKFGIYAPSYTFPWQGSQVMVVVEDHTNGVPNILPVYGVWRANEQNTLMLTTPPELLYTSKARLKFEFLNGTSWKVTELDSLITSWNAAPAVYVGDMFAVSVLIDGQQNPSYFDFQVGTIHNKYELYVEWYGGDDIPQGVTEFTVDVQASDTWTLYRVPLNQQGQPVYYNGPEPGQLNLHWAAFKTFVDTALLCPYSADPQVWTVQRRLESEDFDGTLTLPDGTVQAHTGDIKVGGATDVWVNTVGRAATFPIQPLVNAEPIANGLDAYTDAQHDMWLMLPTQDMSVLNIHQVVELVGLGVNRFFPIVNINPPYNRVKVSGTLPLGLTNQEYIVHGPIAARLWDPSVTAQTGNSLRTNLSNVVNIQAGVAPTVVPTMVLTVDSGILAEQEFTVDSILGSNLILNRAAESLEKDLSYHITSAASSVSRPTGDVSSVELLETNGSSSGIVLPYARPVLVRVLGDSVTDGNDAILPSGAYPACSGTVASVLGKPQYGTLAWTPNWFVHLGVQVGHILHLRGEHNYGVAIITAVTPGGLFFMNFGEFTIQDENDVEFAIYPPQVATARLYFESPTNLYFGTWFNLSECGRFTEFKSGTRRYIAHPLRTYQEPTFDLNARVLPYKSGKAYVETVNFDFEAAGVEAGSWRITLYYDFLATAEYTETTADVAGMLFTLKVDGVAKSMRFSGDNPIPMNDAAANGVVQQLEAAFPVKVVQDPSDHKYYFMSYQALEVVASQGTTYFGLVAGATNAADMATTGTFDITEVLDTPNEKRVVVKTLADTVPNFAASPGHYFSAKLWRTGHLHIAAPAMALQQDRGLYYQDVELYSFGGGEAMALHADDVLTMERDFFCDGYWLEASQDFSRSDREQMTLNMSPLVPGLDGATRVPVPYYGVAVSHTSHALTLALQSALRTEDHRSTCEDVLVREKPRMRLGVGPLTNPRGVTAAQLTERLAPLVGSVLGSSDKVLRLPAVLQSLAPYGVLGTTSTRLVALYEATDRTRHLALAEALTLSRLWDTSVDPTLITL